MTWQTVDEIGVNELIKARMQLHEAVQIIASAGISFCKHQADDSHTNMKWLNKYEAFAGNEFGNHHTFRLALNFPEMKFLLLQGKQNILANYSIHGRTVQQIIDWFREELENRNFDTAHFTQNKHYEIPATGHGTGKAFDLFDQTAFKTLSDHFANAQLVLKKIAYQYSGSSPVRCWPHHFDLGMMISLQAGDDPEEARSIGMGFSPGDDNYKQPYYYVYPWPYPETKLLKNDDLPGNAFWHTKGFVSAILKASDFIKETDQHKTVESFLETAKTTSKKILLD
jgi:hypothetical protein